MPSLVVIERNPKPIRTLNHLQIPAPCNRGWLSSSGLGESPLGSSSPALAQPPRSIHAVHQSRRVQEARSLRFPIAAGRGGGAQPRDARGAGGGNRLVCRVSPTTPSPRHSPLARRAAWNPSPAEASSDPHERLGERAPWQPWLLWG